MRWRIFKIQREPGFRLNGFDLAFLMLLAGISWVLWRAAPEASFWGLPLYLGGSFFQFCNVFRIGNRLEALWYVPFVVIAGYGLGTNDLERFWWFVVMVLEPIKWGLVAYRVLHGPYRGIGYRWVARYRAQNTRTASASEKVKLD